jgi:DNA polymerase-4
VGGSATGRGVVAAANYEARQYGVHSAMPMSRAVRLCPELVCMPVQMDLYVQVSHEIHAIFQRYTPVIEPLSLDEAFLDVSESTRLFGDASSIARMIKNTIKDELNLVASVGVAPNKYLAKIASDIDKPDGFVEILPEQMQDFLDPLPASRIWGVGKVTNATLDRYGIHTIKQVRQQPIEWLKDRFGKFGEQLWALSRGLDNREVVTDSNAKSISNETTFSTDIYELHSLQSWLMSLTEQVGRRLRAHNLFGKTVHLKLRFSDFTTITRSQTLDQATQTTHDIWKQAEQLLKHAFEQQSRPVRLIGIGVSNLEYSTQTSGVQQDMFSPASNARQNHLDEISDKIQSKFGDASIKRATSIKH